jgi:hypothetical protein
MPHLSLLTFLFFPGWFGTADELVLYQSGGCRPVQYGDIYYRINHKLGVGQFAKFGSLDSYVSRAVAFEGLLADRSSTVEEIVM